LPTSMAKCNLLYALGRRPDRAFALVGAAFAAQAEWLAFGLALERACAHLQPAGRRRGDAAERKAELVARFTQALQGIERQFGAAAFTQAVQGVAAAERLAERARWAVAVVDSPLRRFRASHQHAYRCGMPWHRP
jgi:hypothetical protein